jgi:hypothetical protein
MKKIAFFVAIILLLVLGACTLPIPTGEAPTAELPATETTEEAFKAPTNTPVPTQAPAFTETSPPTQAAPAEESPTYTPLPAKPTAQPAASQPTATKPAPTASPVPKVTVVPTATFGEPTYHNPMEVPNVAEWASAGTRTMPDTENIRLQFKDGQLYVTGKQLDFSTWWFSYHTLSNAFIQMSYNTENCSGDDAYGMIFRGPPHQAGQSYGYVVSFTCDGKLWVFRLDGVNPWRAENLLDIKEVSAINEGSGKDNVIGVMADGDDMTIYANGVQVGEVQDDHFAKGRVGVFVRSASPDVYTYRVTDFAYWVPEED